jgi:hypothetical protein
MWEVMPSLFLGDIHDARDLASLKSNGISHIVNCAADVPSYFEEEFAYMSLALSDPDPNLGRSLAKTCAFIDEGRRTGKVLVHCIRARSRSPVVILAYLCHAGYPLALAAQRLSRVVRTDPGEAFLRQLADYVGLKLSAAEFEHLSAALVNGSSP